MESRHSYYPQVASRLERYKNTGIMPKEQVSHASLEVMSFTKSISLRYTIRINEFHCLASYNCPFVVSWYSVDSNLLAN